MTNVYNAYGKKLCCFDYSRLPTPVYVTWAHWPATWCWSMPTMTSPLMSLFSWRELEPPSSPLVPRMEPSQSSTGLLIGLRLVDVAINFMCLSLCEGSSLSCFVCSFYDFSRLVLSCIFPVLFRIKKSPEWQLMIKVLLKFLSSLQFNIILIGFSLLKRLCSATKNCILQLSYHAFDKIRKY